MAGSLLADNDRKHSTGDRDRPTPKNGWTGNDLKYFRPFETNPAILKANGLKVNVTITSRQMPKVKY